MSDSPTMGHATSANRLDAVRAPAQPFGDYRDSHQEKGEDYHRLFRENPYARMLWAFEQRILDRVVGGLPESGRLRHLDFACGTGRIIGHLQSFCRESIGVDVSSSMLAVARRTAPDASFVCGDLTSTPLLENEQFDVITAFRFFLNAEPRLRRAAMRRLAGMLAQNGVMIFNNHRQAGSLTHRILLRLRRGRTDLHYMADREVRELVNESGLRIAAIYHVGVLPATEQRVVLPAWVMRPIERAGSRLSLFRPLANDIIYVCVRA